MKKMIYGAGILLVLAGAVAFGYQCVHGLGAGNVNNGSSWGLYIICFMFTEGIGSGAMGVAAVISILKLEAYRTLVKPAALTALISMGLAQAFLGMDLGNPLNAWHMMLTPNLVSPMVWDFMSISLFMLVSLVFLWSLYRPQAQLAKLISLPALLMAILVPSVSAWLFATLAAHPSWNSALLAPLFVISSLDSGLAMVLLLGLSHQEMADTLKGITLQRIATVLLALVLTDAFLLLSELVQTAHANTPATNLLLSQLTTGPVAVYFWGEIFLEILIPAVLLSKAARRQQVKLVKLAVVLVILGVFCKRAWILLAGYLSFNLSGAPGVIRGASSVIGKEGAEVWALQGIYYPSCVEILVAGAALAAGCFAYGIAHNWLTKREAS